MEDIYLAAVFGCALLAVKAFQYLRKKFWW